MNPLGNSNMFNMMNNIQKTKNMMNMLKSPESVIKSNPQIKQIMDMCKGKNPQQVFYDECQRRNIDPESILSQLR